MGNSPHFPIEGVEGEDGGKTMGCKDQVGQGVRRSKNFQNFLKENFEELLYAL
jgi:hypothetical protein